MPPRTPARVASVAAAALAVWIAAALVAAGAQALQPGAPLPGYAHRAWPSLAHSSTVRAVLAGRRGPLWIGTSDGLVRLDGQRFSSVDGRALPGIVEGNIGALLETADGSLWVGSADRGLSRLRGKEVVTWRARDGLPSDRVRALAQTADGSLWVGTDGGPAVFAPGSSRPVPAREGLPSGRTTALAVDARGLLWAGSLSGLAHWDAAHERWHPEPGPFSTPPRISTLFAGPNGDLWVGTDGDGLWRRRGSDWRSYSVEQGLGSARVSAILQDRDGQVWVGTRDGSLTWLDGERFRSLGLAPRFCDQNVESLAEDAEGGLWMGTEACGLHRIEERPIRTLDEGQGLPRNAALGLAGSRDGRIVWASTRGGGMARILVATAQTMALPCGPGLPCARCWDIAPGAGDTFRAICSKTLLEWNGRSLDRAALPVPLGTGDLVIEAQDGALWLAIGTRVVRHADGETLPITGHESLKGKRVLYQGGSGTVWIAADDGVAGWRAGQLTLHRLPPGQDPAEASNLHEDGQGTLWIGTKGAGLRRLRAGRLSTVTSASGLPTNWIVQILEDDRGHLWLSGSKGIFSIDRQELHELADGRRSSLHASIYDGTDGVLMSSDSFGHPAGWRSPDGRLWFATHGGVAVVDPGKTRTRPAPRALIEEARIGDYKITLDLGGRDLAGAASVPGSGPPSGKAAPLVLGPGARDLEARFAVLSFAPPETISFRYRLQGKDPEWVEAGLNRTAHYAGLGPGRYQLEVQARHRNGDWGAADGSLRFVLRPPFYSSLWFAFLMMVSALLTLLLVHRLRLGRARSGLHAIMAERARIARDLHDTLAQAFVATSVQLECVDHALEGQDRPGARKHLDTAMRVVRDSLEEARRSVWVLRPQALERGLPAALETLVRRASAERQPLASMPGSTPPGAAVSLEVSGVARPLSPLTEANLLRIAQEAVANAYRHARASRISLRLAFEADSVILSVIDDGTGIIEAAERGGVQQGLAGMKERATEMGATISIESADPGGTAIRVEVPARARRWFARGRRA